MPKVLRSGALVLTVAVLICLVGFVHARVSGGPARSDAKTTSEVL